MISVSKLKEYHLSLIYIVFLIICSFDSDLNKENEFFTIILTGFWSADYDGSALKRFRDLFIYCFYYSIFISISFFKFGYVSLKIISLNIVIIISIYFIGWLIGKLLILKTSIYNSVKQSVLIIFSYTCIVVIFRDVLIAHSIWVIVILIFIIYYFNKGFSFLKTLIITVPLFLIEIIMFLFNSNIFIEVGVIYFIVYLIGLFLAWKMKLTFHKKSTYYFISVGVLLISFVIIPFALNIMNQKKSNSYTALPKVFEKPLLQNNDTISLNDFKGKVLVLDFWHSSCGSCFEKFPQFEKLASKYKSNKDILFFAVNTPFNRGKTKDPKKIMDSLNYKFDNLFLIDDSIAKGLGIEYYPTVLYIDKTQTKIISGNVETDFWIYNNSFNIIDHLYNE